MASNFCRDKIMLSYEEKSLSAYEGTRPMR